MPAHDPHAGCPHCVAGGYTYSEAYRLECEARHVVSIRGLEHRRIYLEGVTKKRGEDEANRLRAVATQMFYRMQEDRAR